MKQLLFFGLIMFQSIAFSQIEMVSGTYQFSFEGSNGTFGETIILHPKGSFNIHSVKELDGSNPPEINAYGRGTWKLDKKIVYFTATDADFDAKFTLNLNHTQARFHTKSPRDTTNREMATTIQIIKSDISWLVGRKLIKQ